MRRYRAAASSTSAAASCAASLSASGVPAAGVSSYQETCPGRSPRTAATSSVDVGERLTGDAVDEVDGQRAHAGVAQARERARPGRPSPAGRARAAAPASKLCTPSETRRPAVRPAAALPRRRPRGEAAVHVLRVRLHRDLGVRREPGPEELEQPLEPVRPEEARRAAAEVQRLEAAHRRAPPARAPTRRRPRPRSRRTRPPARRGRERPPRRRRSHSSRNETGRTARGRTGAAPARGTPACRQPDGARAEVRSRRRHEEVVRPALLALEDTAVLLDHAPRGGVVHVAVDARLADAEGGGAAAAPPPASPSRARAAGRPGGSRTRCCRRAGAA